MKIIIIIAGIVIIGTAVLLTQKATYAPAPTPSPKVINLNSEMDTLDAQDLDGMDNSLNQVNADSSSF